MPYITMPKGRGFTAFLVSYVFRITLVYGKDNVFSCCYVDLSESLFYNKFEIVRLVTVFQGRGLFWHAEAK